MSAGGGLLLGPEVAEEIHLTIMAESRWLKLAARIITRLTGRRPPWAASPVERIVVRVMSAELATYFDELLLLGDQETKTP